MSVTDSWIEINTMQNLQNSDTTTQKDNSDAKSELMLEPICDKGSPCRIPATHPKKG